MFCCLSTSCRGLRATAKITYQSILQDDLVSQL